MRKSVVVATLFVALVGCGGAEQDAAVDGGRAERGQAEQEAAAVDGGEAEQEAAVDDGRAPPPAALPTAPAAPASAMAPHPTLPGQFVQTWPKPYDETSCDDWNVEMGLLQWQTAAAEMLVAVRGADGKEELPDGTQLARFNQIISQRCASGDAGSRTIVEVARSVYSEDAAEGAPRVWQ